MKQQQIKVRSMLSMSTRCKTCGNYMSRGTKFNSRKEKVMGDKYLACIQKYRLYSKCTRCSAEFSILTDPQNSDYIVESGATRNFEAYYYYIYNDEKRKREEADQEDGMQSLEHKALDSKRAMDIISSLDEMISMKARRATLTQDALLQSLHRTSTSAARKKLLEEEEKEKEKDEALIKSIIFRNKSPRTTTTCSSTTPSTIRNNYNRAKQ
ncbi:CWC16 protein [Trema orientale]|uniref:CWC16 protein n=1 Tax=Trema orientale TaxID=63057 RepID=A0A2P5G179_TREOI|nr:CWC16 protein [Trema orientale]